MSLYEQLIENEKRRPPCIDCIHLKELRTCFFCMAKDKAILPNYPPNKCDLRQEKPIVKEPQQEFCMYCGYTLKHLTPKSPRNKYKFCPMCGKKLKEGLE